MRIVSHVLNETRRFFAGRTERQVEDSKVLLGKLLAEQYGGRTQKQHFADIEFKVFSQFGEDGIIQYLLSRLPRIPKSFVEFGVEDYTESNTRFLLMSQNWRGLVIEADAAHVETIKRSDLYWQHDITAINAFVTTANVDKLFVDSGFEGPIGILSIDIDGNDYWIWKAITSVNPALVIIEYNGLWGRDSTVSTPYVENFNRSKAHSSMLYFGASLAALELLGSEKGYELVGSNSHGTNAFFVRGDLMNQLSRRETRDVFVDVRIRQARDPSGNLTHGDPKEAARAFEGLPLIDVRDGSSLQVRSLLGA